MSDGLRGTQHTITVKFIYLGRQPGSAAGAGRAGKGARQPRATAPSRDIKTYAGRLASLRGPRRSRLVTDACRLLLDRRSSAPSHKPSAPSAPSAGFIQPYRTAPRALSLPRAGSGLAWGTRCSITGPRKLTCKTEKQNRYTPAENSLAVAQAATALLAEGGIGGA